jgi:ABC-type transporter lipoprotein component MlaA
MSIDGQISDPIIEASLTVTDKVNARANVLPYDHIIDTAYDPYALIRNFWFQKREHKVLVEGLPDDKLPDDKLPDDTLPDADDTDK